MILKINKIYEKKVKKHMFKGVGVVPIKVSWA